MSELGPVEPWLESSTSKSRTDLGSWLTMTISVEGEAPSAFCLMVSASLLRRRFSVLFLVGEAELAGGCGEKVEGAKHDAASWNKSLAAGER